MTYIDPDLIADDTSVAEGALAGIADHIPGWEAHEGHVETAMAEAWGAALATAYQVLLDEVASAYEGFGEILDTPRVRAAPAEGLATWTFATTAPPLIPGGTQAEATNAEGELILFAVLEDTPISSGVLVAAGVPMIAVEPGTAGNDITGELATSELADVASIMLEAATAGGSEDETVEDYRSRLADRARRVRALPITPEDYAAMALDVEGVDRAIAVNRYNPNTPGVDSPGDVTVFGLAPNGDVLGPATSEDLRTYYAATEQVLNTRAFVADPNFVTLTVAVTAQATDGYDTTIVAEDVRQALTTAFDPANWDRDDDRPARWKTTPTTLVTVFRVAAAIDDLPSLRSITAITINGGASNVVLPAPVSLPRLVFGTITITN